VLGHCGAPPVLLITSPLLHADGIDHPFFTKAQALQLLDLQPWPAAAPAAGMLHVHRLTACAACTAVPALPPALASNIQYVPVQKRRVVVLSGVLLSAFGHCWPRCMLAGTTAVRAAVQWLWLPASCHHRCQLDQPCQCSAVTAAGLSPDTTPSMPQAHRASTKQPLTATGSLESRQPAGQQMPRNPCIYTAAPQQDTPSPKCHTHSSLRLPCMFFSAALLALPYTVEQLSL
jgi:hypothetical protein